MRRVLTKTSVVRCASISSREPVVDLLPDLGRHHRFERRGRHLEREIARADVAGVDDRAVGRARRRPATDQETRHLFDRLLRGRQARSAAAGRRTARASRSSDRARCEPRLFGAMAWISSTITVRVVASIARPDSEPSRM